MDKKLKRPQSMDEARVMEEFEEVGYVWLKLADNIKVLVMDHNCEPVTAEIKEH